MARFVFVAWSYVWIGQVLVDIGKVNVLCSSGPFFSACSRLKHKTIANLSISVTIYSWGTWRLLILQQINCLLVESDALFHEAPASRFRLRDWLVSLPDLLCVQWLSHGVEVFLGNFIFLHSLAHVHSAFLLLTVNGVQHTVIRRRLKLHLANSDTVLCAVEFMG